MLRDFVQYFGLSLKNFSILDVRATPALKASDDGQETQKISLQMYRKPK